MDSDGPFALELVGDGPFALKLVGDVHRMRCTGITDVYIVNGNVCSPAYEYMATQSSMHEVRLPSAASGVSGSRGA